MVINAQSFSQMCIINSHEKIIFNILIFNIILRVILCEDNAVCSYL